jgi:hypothetical protein
MAITPTHQFSVGAAAFLPQSPCLSSCLSGIKVRAKFELDASGFVWVLCRSMPIEMAADDCDILYQNSYREKFCSSMAGFNS